MDETDYKLLLELYETKNITKTANKLFSTQPTLTKRIQKIEEELGCQLFLRSKKGILFTPIGEALIPYARQMTKLSEQMHSEINIEKGTIGGTLSLGSSLNYAHYRLPSILKRYTALYPAVDIYITTGQSKDLFRMLQRDEISIAITRGDFPWNEGRVLIGTEPLCLVCSVEDKDRPLDSYLYIGRQTDPALIDEMERWKAEHHLKATPSRLHVDNIDSAKEMAAQGLGWCILPEICLENFRGHIQKLYFKDGTPFERQTWLLYKREYFGLPQVQFFIQQLLGFEALK